MSISGTRVLPLTITGIIVGMASDYLLGNMILAVLLVALISGLGARSIGWAILISTLSNITWLTASYVYLFVQEGSWGMTDLLSGIAGFSLLGVIGLVYAIVILLSVFSSVSFHYLRRALGG